MGDGNMYWYSELDKLGVEAAWKCATKARASGWPTAGRVPRTSPESRAPRAVPGVTQLATAFVVAAARAESPLVAFCGEHPPSDDGYNQRFDQPRFAAACETGFVRLQFAGKRRTTPCARRSTSRSSNRGP